MLLHRISVRGKYTTVETIGAASTLHAPDDADVFVVEIVPVIDDMRAPPYVSWHWAFHVTNPAPLPAMTAMSTMAKKPD